MSRPDSLTDPSDWYGLPTQPLARVEFALRCQVCKEFFQTPMITTCSHTFCSLCIRRCLTEDGKCPACRSQETINKLRKNAAIEELVDAFQIARPIVLQLHLEPTDEHIGSKRKFAGSETEEVTVKFQRQTRSVSQPRQHKNSKGTSELSEDPGISNDDVPEGHSRCPICQQEMRVEMVYSHLDTHNGEQYQVEDSVHLKSRHLPVHPPRPNLAPLPSINYAIMNETTLRKKLVSLGIPASGPKTALQRRHTAYVNIWNANCDSSTPKPKRQLLQDLDTWERSQDSHHSDPVMGKNFDGKAWSEQHESGFQDLIAKARSHRTQYSSGSPENG